MMKATCFAAVATLLAFGCGSTGTAGAPYTVHVVIQADGGAPGADFGSWSITQNEGLAFSASGDSDTNVSPVIPSTGDFYAGRAHTISFTREAGYATPAAQQITAATTVTANYVPAVGVSKGVMFVGHSLLDEVESYCAKGIAESLGHTFLRRSQHLPGAPLRVNWGSPPPADRYQANARDELPSGDFDTLIMTETIPIEVYAPNPNETTLYGGNFFDLIKSAVPTADVYLYETWVCTDAGTPGSCEGELDSNPLTFREHMDADKPIWQAPVDNINAASAHDGMKVIPIGSEYLARFYDEIALGNMTGFANIDDAYPDKIHPINAVRYMWALAIVATIYDIDIRGATNVIHDIDGGLVPGMPTATQAAEMQALVYDVWSANR